MSDSKEKKGNWFMRHKVLTGILVFIVFIVVVSASGGDSSNNGSGDSGSKQEQSQKQEKVTAKIGEQVQSGDLAFTVNGVKEFKSLGNSFTQKDSQGIFKVVSLKIENVGKETKTIDSSRKILAHLRNSQMSGQPTRLYSKTMEPELLQLQLSNPFVVLNTVAIGLT